MTKRENLLRLLRRQGYEAVPIELYLCDSLKEDYHRIESSPLSYFDFFDSDARRLPFLTPDDPDTSRFLPYYGGSLSPDTTLDEWGVGHRKTASSMHMSQMLCPLKEADSLEQIEAYPLPAFSPEANPDLEKQVREIHSRGYASIGCMACTVWETSWYIRGMEELMMDMMDEDPMAECLLDRVTEISVARARMFARAGVDILFVGDDVGTQRALMMSESLYCTWLKPRLKRVIDAARAIKPDILVYYHSCGYVTPLIPHFIEAGVDVLNPVQPECMDFGEIHHAFGDVLSFSGTIGTQNMMSFGTPEEIRQEVFKNLKIAGDKGGLWVSPTHLLEPEVPWENILAYVQACRDFCK